MEKLLKVAVGLAGSAIVIAGAGLFFLVGMMSMSGDNLKTTASQVIFGSIILATLVMLGVGLVRVWRHVLRP